MLASVARAAIGREARARRPCGATRRRLSDDAASTFVGGDRRRECVRLRSMDPAIALAQVRRRPPISDLAVAGTILAWALLEALLASGPGSRLARVAYACLIALPLVVRRRAPLSVIVVISVVTVAWAFAA